jgi:hypothetical protein
VTLQSIHLQAWTAFSRAPYAEAQLLPQLSRWLDLQILPPLIAREKQRREVVLAEASVSS